MALVFTGGLVSSVFTVSAGGLNLCSQEGQVCAREMCVLC